MIRLPVAVPIGVDGVVKVRVRLWSLKCTMAGLTIPPNCVIGVPVAHGRLDKPPKALIVSTFHPLVEIPPQLAS